MKIAIKHRINDCKDYMASHTTVIIENLKGRNSGTGNTEQF